MLLVTGITGHTGGYFLQELIKHNYKGHIRCVVRETSDTTQIDNSGLLIEKVVGDINDKEFIENIMIDVEMVMHIYNIHHSPMILEAAIRNKVKRVIMVHTTGIYSTFKNASKGYKMIENKVFELANSSDCKTKITILRPTMIYGDILDSNISKFIKMVDKLRIFPVINRGDNLLQPVNARDLGIALYDVILYPKQTQGKAYDLSGSTPIKMIDLLKLISGELNKNTIFVSIPLKVGVFAAKVLNLISLKKINYIEKVQRMAENRSYSHESATTDFGYNPMPLKKGIQIEVAEYMEAKERNEESTNIS